MALSHRAGQAKKPEFHDGFSGTTEFARASFPKTPDDSDPPIIPFEKQNSYRKA
jgi:hypothetical protein